MATRSLAAPVGPAPTVGDDTELFRRYAAGDLSARELIAERHMPMARRLAGRYGNTSEHRDDLEQVAYLGLLKAIDRYRPDGGSFVGFAITCIRGDLKRHFRDKGWGMRVPRPLQERYLRVKEAIAALSPTLGRSPTPRELAVHTGMALEDVLEGLAVADAYAPSPLDARRFSEGDSTTVGDSIGVEDPGYATAEWGAAIGPAFRALPRREQQILYLRFIEDLTQSEIAARMAISQMHVSRLLRNSLTALSTEIGPA